MSSIKTKKRINISIAFFIMLVTGIFTLRIFAKYVSISLKEYGIICSMVAFLTLTLYLFFMIKIDWLKDVNTSKEIMYLNISNWLSSLRFIFIPVLITMFAVTMNAKLIDENVSKFKVKLVISIFGAIIALTDLFDGYFARKLNQITILGKIIDPLGDFLMVASFAILIFSQHIISTYFFILILIRVFGMIIMMAGFYMINIRPKILSSFLGKTTIFYLLSFLGFSTLIILFGNGNHHLHTLLKILEIPGAILIITSFIEKIVLFINYKKKLDN